MDPSLLCKMFFTLGTAVGVGGTLFPSFRDQIMNYGSRTITNSTTRNRNTNDDRLQKFMDFVASFRVPHTWFIHYYLASVFCSLFWAFQVVTHGNIFKFLAYQSRIGGKGTGGGMTINQVLLAWTFMMIQGSRRLYECLTLTKPSQAKMWMGLWMIGIGYYFAMSLSIWIEGIVALNVPNSWKSLVQISSPSRKSCIAIPLFIVASTIQHDCHVYLAGLKKYTLPQRYLFRMVVCPHYTSECLIYLAIAMVAAPEGQTFNKTILAGLAFVVSNLAVTADSTRKWYAEKFGQSSLKGRWRLLPYVY